MASWVGLGLLVIAGLALVFTDNPGKVLNISDEQFAQTAWAAALMAVIGSSLILSYRGRAGLAVKQAASWVAIGFSLVAIYTYRVELMSVGSRLMGEISPGTPVIIASNQTPGDGPAVVAISANANGHFSVNAMINDTHVELIADTGATLVALTHEDAQRIGIDVKKLRYSVQVSTANGKTFSAPVTLAFVEIGSIRTRKVRALVTKPGSLHKSLLGMSFFKKISSFEISGNRMVLRQ